MKLFEVQDIFKNLDIIKLDPDRADSYDVVYAILPTLVRMSYTYLLDDLQKYKKSHGDDQSFKFDKAELIDRVNDLIVVIQKRFSSIDDKDISGVIDSIKNEFDQKLDDEEKPIE